MKFREIVIAVLGLVTIPLWLPVALILVNTTIKLNQKAKADERDR